MNKNIKDTQSSISTQSSNFGEQGALVSFSKTYQPAIVNKAGKLITALYMVTDVMDKEEPIKNKLRTLGTEIISDMHSVPSDIDSKITEIMSFLNIATAMSFISEMNCSILKKEFSVLQQSIKESAQMKPAWLEDFLEEEFPPLLDKEGNEGRFLENSPHPNPLLIKPARLERSGGERGSPISKGHVRIGVQKRDAFLKIIKDMSDRSIVSQGVHTGSDFGVLKKQRRNDIINMVKVVGGSATITDIRDQVQMAPAQAGLLVSCSEKTLQRELMSMTKDGLLKKTGEKRWSRD